MIYDEKIINEIRDHLLDKHQTIAVAESVTSGHLQAAISLAIDASKFYQGGITVYNAGQKTRHLNIEPLHAERVNCVAEKVATDMALNVSKMFLSNYGIGITGYASIVPQCEQEGLFAFFAFTFNGEVVISRKLTTTKTSPFDAQVDYTLQVLNIIHEHLK